MSNNKYKTLVSNTMLISLGTFGRKLLVFFMLRFYTSYLTPADYGTADLITQTANLLFPLISLGITDGVFRFAVDHTEQRRNIFSVGVYTILAGALLLVALLPLLGLFPQFDGFLWLIALYTLCSCLPALCAQFVRAQGHTAFSSSACAWASRAMCSRSRWRIWRARCFWSCASGSGGS